jgi:hypothetical protein
MRTVRSTDRVALTYSTSKRPAKLCYYLLYLYDHTLCPLVSDEVNSESHMLI